MMVSFFWNYYQLTSVNSAIINKGKRGEAGSTKI